MEAGRPGATTFQFGGAEALNDNRTQANYIISAGIDGSIKIAFITSKDLKCTTMPATEGQMAKMECMAQAEALRSARRALALKTSPSVHLRQ